MHSFIFSTCLLTKFLTLEDFVEAGVDTEAPGVNGAPLVEFDGVEECDAACTGGVCIRTGDVTGTVGVGGRTGGACLTGFYKKSNTCT